MAQIFLDRVNRIFRPEGCTRQIPFLKTTHSTLLMAGFCRRVCLRPRSSGDDPQMALRLAELEFPIDNLRFNIWDWDGMVSADLRFNISDFQRVKAINKAGEGQPSNTMMVVL